MLCWQHLSEIYEVVDPLLVELKQIEVLYLFAEDTETIILSELESLLDLFVQIKQTLKRIQADNPLKTASFKLPNTCFVAVDDNNIEVLG
jgi:hypothetical protein